MRGEEREGELILRGMMKRKVEMVVGGVKRWVSSGNQDIRSQEVQDFLPFMVWGVVGVLPLLGLFPRLGFFPELGG